MENTEEDSTTKKSTSPIGEFKRVDIIDLTEDNDNDKAATEGGKFGGGVETSKGIHSSENTRMKLTSGEAGSKPRSAGTYVTRSAGTYVTKHKRKISKGEYEVTTDKKISEEKGSLPNEPAIHVNKIEDLNAKKKEADPLVSKNNDVGQDAKIIRSFNLNDPLVDEDEGGESDEKVKGNEDSLPTQELQGLDLPAHEAEEPISIKEIDTESLPAKNQKLRTSEVDSFAVEKTKDSTGEAKIFKFDLNELPTEVDKNWF